MSSSVIEHGADLLEMLRYFEMPRLSRRAFDAKFREIQSGGRLISRLTAVRDKLRQQSNWCHAVAAIFRDVPNDKSAVATILSNIETTAALLAVRSGINMHLAVSLAADGLISVWPIINGVLPGSPFDPDDSAVLATFANGRDRNDRFALIAHLDAVDYTPTYAPHELILFDQHPSEGLHAPFRTNYFDGHLTEAFAFTIGKPLDVVECSIDNDVNLKNASYGIERYNMLGSRFDIVIDHPE